MSQHQNKENNDQYASEGRVKWNDLYRKRIADRLRVPFARRLLGDLTDLTVVDMACGTGNDTLRFADETKHVIGIDVSPGMIEHARRQQGDDVDNVDFLVGDCSDVDAMKSLLHDERADLVYSSYMLSYAEDVSKLAGFIRAMYETLRDGGRCVGLMWNMNQQDQRDLRKNAECYSVATEMLRQADENVSGIVRFRVIDKDMAALNKSDNAVIHYFYPAETYERLFAEAGFVRFKWLFPKVTDYPKSEQKFVKTLVDSPKMIGFEAEK